MLNSDGLGAKGEARFAELCADAGIIANASSRDRTGWDFYVEFLFCETLNQEHLDSRPQPIESKFQIKTVFENAANIKLRLSSAERLAKNPGAAFVAVFVVDRHTQQFTAMHMLHVRGGVLSVILKRLRECERDNSLRINKEYIRLNHRRDGELIDLSGVALKDYIVRCIGHNFSSYHSEKKSELENLGVTGTRYSISMVIRALNETEITDVLLGLKSGKVEKFEIHETRWAIRLPEKFSSGETEVLINPQPFKAQLTIRATNKLPVSEQVDIILPADTFLRGKIIKAWVKGESFEMLIDRPSKTSSFEYHLGRNVGITLSSWMKVVKTQEILLKGGELEIRRRSGVIYNGKIDSCSATITQQQIEDMRYLIEGLQMISNAAGDAEFKATVADLNAARDQIRFIRDLFDGFSNVRLNPIRIKSSDSFPKNLRVVDCLFFSRFGVGESQIAWSAVGTVDVQYKNAAAVDFVVGSLSLRRVELIEAGEESITEFRRMIQKETGINIVTYLGNMTWQDDMAL